MNCCNKPMTNWSCFNFNKFNTPVFEEKTSHFYCKKCGSHHHNGKAYSKEEWFFYINEETFAGYKRQQETPIQKLQPGESDPRD